MNLLQKLGLNMHNAGVCLGPSQWLENKNYSDLVSHNPTTEQPIASVYTAKEGDLDTIIQSANHHFLTWRMVPSPKRGEIVRQIGQKLREKKSMLGDLIVLEMGKSKQEADGEVQEMIDMADFAVGQSRMLYGKTMHSERVAHRMVEQWQPLGPIAVITSFNFPVAVWAWNAFIAAICGDTIIWKPSSKTPLSAIAVQNICNDVMHENQLMGIFSLFITDNRDLSEQLVCDPRIALVSFTGSSSVGKKVNTRVANRMGRCLLECSGNNAIIVDETADLQLAIPAILFGAIGTAGQRCTSTRRIFLPKTIFHQVSDALVSAYQKIKVGDPMDFNNHMGPLIDQSAVTLFQEAIENLKKHGANMVTGGNRLDRTGYFVEPTIAHAENHWDIVQAETFAPILYLITYKTIEDAITQQNAVSQGLSSALFTRDIKTAELFLSAKGSDCGIANINIGTSGAEIGGAFGGEKETGGGREAGSDAWKAYMRRQTTTINWGDALPLAQGIHFNIV